MSRRIRFTPWSCHRTFIRAGVVACSLLGAAEAAATEIPFAPASVISTQAGRPSSVVPGDIDRDGDQDLVVGWVEGSLLAWLENANGGSTWTLRTIATTLNAIRFVTVDDVDGDGDLDVVTGSFGTGVVAWCENTAGNGSAWLVHTIATVAEPLRVAAADMDGDGDVDALSGTFPFAGTGALYFHENSSGNGSSWTLRTVFQGAFVNDVAAADVDGDGDRDAVRSSPNDGVIAWHDNLLGNGSVWVTRTVTTTFGAQSVVAGDVDGDGDLDLAAGVSVVDQVVWFENIVGNGQGWVRHTISTLSDAGFGLTATDLDGDGDLDLIGAGPPGDSIEWHENVSGNGTAWTTRTVGLTADVPYAATAVDLDGDGDPDIASAASFGNEIAWFRNNSVHQTACFGPVNTVFSTDAPFGSDAADIDRDGDLDVFATSWSGTDVVTWHRNEGGGNAWSAFTVATGHQTFIVDAADIDGDGDADALLGADVNNPASWAENIVAGSVWAIQAVATPSPALPPLELRAADIDGDGDLDAVAPAFNTSFLSWYENQDGLGDLWLLRTVATAAPDRGVEPVDLDRDGDLDLLTFSTPLAWYENTAGNGSAWTRRTIAAAGALSAGVLDLDRDGDPDIFAALDTLSVPEILWHENVSGNGATWATHSLSTVGSDFVNMRLDDLDRDGDLDIVSGFSPLSWLERTGPGVAFAIHTVATDPGAVGTVGTPDLDGDGDADALWTSQLGDAVRWNGNGRGQVVLDLLDQVPSTVLNNDVFPILRVTVTHGGRGGDSDLELARLGLLFEEDLGDPLTSAEANALVEELRIYRDANGNGVFEPGTDTLVATVPTLALTAGVQTVTLADADPNVQVAFGTPRTFFVVAQLTANASQQVPHQFRLTHLAVGPSATVAEDRSADIPLTIACPADFPSRLIVATPVELIGFTVE